MRCRSLIILAVFHFVSMITICVAATANESCYPTHQSQWKLEKHNIIYPDGYVVPDFSACMVGPRPSTILLPGHRSKSLRFKSREENSYVKYISVYQDRDAIKVVIGFRKNRENHLLFPEFKQLSKKIKPYAQEDFADTLLSQISAAEDHAYAFLRVIYEEKLIPDFMAQEILKVFGGIDFRIEGYVPYAGNIEEPRPMPRRQPIF